MVAAASRPEPLCWVDGRLAKRSDPALGVDDSAYREGRGCYTTVRIAAGRPRFLQRHAARLRRDARALGIGELEEARVRRAVLELAVAALPEGEGIVRLQASREGSDRLRLVAVTRPLEEPGSGARGSRAAGSRAAGWVGAICEFPHEGPSPYSGCKVTNRLLHALAQDGARAAGADEALLLDAQGFLVEGARSNVFVVGPDGALVTPSLERGGVAGIAREVLLERMRPVGVRDVSRAELRAAEEIFAVNAVRGAVPLLALDGRPVGHGRASRWLDLLERALAQD